VLYFPFWISKTAKNFLKSKNSEEKELFMQKYGVLFEIFEEERFIQSGFFMIITIKRILFSFNLVTLNYFPVSSQFFFILLDIALLVVLLKSKPYKEKIFYYRDIIAEIAYIVIHCASIAIYKEFSEK
jgi:hypothetical protein